jgi:predicted MPP superfamily phosphohydrolase
MLFYITGNLYLGYRFVAVFRERLPLAGGAVAAVWLAVALLPLLLRNDSEALPNGPLDLLYLLGAYWIAIIYYGLMLAAICDLANFLQKTFRLAIFRPSAQATGGAVLTILLALMSYGAYNAQNPRVTNYKIKIDKPAAIGKMRIAMLSDLHLGKINGEKSVARAVAMVNGLDADVLFIVGDTVDGDINSLYRKRPLDGLKNVNTKFGVYAVMGNHEYIGGRESKDVEAYLNSRYMTVLVDKGVTLPNGVYVVGRDDYSRAGGKQSLAPLLAGRGEQPIIVLDHQPSRLKEAQAAGADLILCGHTHKGQIAPNNLITSYIFPIDYGYAKLDRLNVIVTCGFGTWGPPVRIGNAPEIVCVDVEFAPAGKL